MASSSSLVFNVERRRHELVAPASPTPYEIKNLSDVDNQIILRTHTAGVFIYQNVMRMEGIDPVKTIRDAVAKVLVYYYPLAGRVKEGANHKLMVECTGEGALFIEADAHVRLEEFGDVVKPPFPCMEELLYNVPGSDGIVNCPLLLIQVTRLLCGGFIVGIRLNHTMIDAVGIVQFMTALAEMARGVDVPSIKPVWRRELITTRDTPPVSPHHSYEELPDSQSISSLEEPTLIEHTFTFSSEEIVALKEHLPPHLRQSSRIEILTACLWRCRTKSLNVNPNHQVYMTFAVNARNIYNPPLPLGYYGNAFGFPVAQTTAWKLCEYPLEYALELVRKAKTDVTDEFMRSLVKMSQPNPMVEPVYVVSDNTRVGFRDIDFGWGEAVYGGSKGGIIAGVSFFMLLKNQKGEDEIAATVNLPRNAMEKFVQEMEGVTKRPKSTNFSSPLSHL